VARWQPVKLAAMEGQLQTEAGAPLRIGGIPDERAGETRFAAEIPRGLSLLAFHDPDAVVRGLRDFPRNQWPPVLQTHLAFQVMVGLGTFMAVVAVWAAVLAWKKRDLASNVWLMRAVTLAGPMGFICVEAGWTVTELGRQPWVVYNVLRTSEAVTPMPGLVVPFVTFTLLYCFLGAILVWLLYNQVIRSPKTAEGDARSSAVRSAA
jgi:cytochrome bd ubiquinol oxidase subunit I